MSGTVLTVGYDRSPHAIAIAELMRRRGTLLSGIVLVSHFSIERVRTVMRQRGLRPIVNYALRRTAPLTSKKSAPAGPLPLFLAAHGISENSIRTWAKATNVPVRVVSSINSIRSIEFLRNTRPDTVIYAGGGILRKHFIEAAGNRVLNAHSGLLPEVRGMNAVEWSLLLGVPPAVTIHLIDEGIDTGPILETIPVQVDLNDSLEHLRERCTVTGIEGIVKWALEVQTNKPPGCCPTTILPQCYVLAPALRQLAGIRLIELKGRMHHGQSCTP